MKIDCRELAPSSWKEFEGLFGDRGACGGCWCMYWRQKKGEKWSDLKGAEAKRRMRNLVDTERALGVLAYADGEPVGWCALGPRRAFTKLDASPSLRCTDADDVWSIPCFFVSRGFRGKGVAKALLAAALKAIEARGGEVAEGYPVLPPKGAQTLPGAFAWTGTLSLFEGLGFSRVDAKDKGKVRVRKSLRES